MEFMAKQLGHLRTLEFFCEIYIQEINADNRPNGIMTSRGYTNTTKKYKI